MPQYRSRNAKSASKKKTPAVKARRGGVNGKRRSAGGSAKSASMAQKGVEAAALELRGQNRDEPTLEELAAEQTRVDEDMQRQAGALKEKDANQGRDILASYMAQIAHIPLFSAEQEIENARHLEALEEYTWRLILQYSCGVSHAHGTVRGLPEVKDLVRQLEKHGRSLEQAVSLRGAAAREKRCEHLAAELRRLDQDKRLLEEVITRLRREVWGRSSRAVGNGRLRHEELTEIERARGTAVRARNNFVRANLRLVVSVARRFKHYKIPLVDLFQEGNVGLMKAVHRFDHRKGFRFSTYAHWWIRQSIERAIINKGAQVRLPVHVMDARRHISRATSRLTQELERPPTDQEIALATEIPVERVQQLQTIARGEPDSLDDVVGEHDTRCLIDVIRNDDEPAIDEAVIRENTHTRLTELMRMLNPMEVDILRRRFGLGSDSDQTLEEIGKVYNLSRERVRQIQVQGLIKMRRMCDRREIAR